jgi:putative transposase
VSWVSGRWATRTWQASNGRPLRATRPRHFYRRNGVMPEAVELRLTIPAELGPEAEVLAELRQRVAAAEASLATERQRTGTRVYGRRAVLRQCCWARPASFEPRRNLRPRVAARSKWARIEALRRNQDFVADYTTAREAWRSGAPAANAPPSTNAVLVSRADGGDALSIRSIVVGPRP